MMAVDMGRPSSVSTMGCSVIRPRAASSCARAHITSLCSYGDEASVCLYVGFGHGLPLLSQHGGVQGAA